jgi:hypothetical protein
MPPFVAASLPALARKLRTEFGNRKFLLLYAYNGTGKTRLSMAFRDEGRVVNSDGETTGRDTLYFNAFTEDLFNWDNDIASDERRVLKLNERSRFVRALAQRELDTRVRALLSRYADFDFRIDAKVDEKGVLTNAEVIFFLGPASGLTKDGVDARDVSIKISRGEENLFIWCFFLAIVELVLDGDESYTWVKYVYIDDPVSSLDEHNAIVIANHLVQVYRTVRTFGVKTIISTHHHLFFNVLHHELKKGFRSDMSQFVLSRDRTTHEYMLKEQTGDTPSFHHVAALVELDRVARGDEVRTYHFNMLRAIMEKTALFLGYTHFSACIQKDSGDTDGLLHQRFVDLLSHGKYSLFEPVDMGEETKRYFRQILRDFLDRYPYNSKLFPVDLIPAAGSAA